jgi:hypothetical protein
MKTIRFFLLIRELKSILILLLLLFMFLTEKTNAQPTMEFRQLGTYTYDMLDDFMYLGHDNDIVYFYKYNRNQTAISILSANYKDGSPGVMKKIKLPKQYHESEILQLKQDKGQLILLSSYLNIKMRKHFVFKESINMKTGLSNGDLKKIVEFPFLCDAETWETVKSENGQYYAAVVFDFGRKASQDSYLFVLDSDFQLVYRQDDFFRPLKGYSIIKEFIVDNNGKVYCMIQSYQNEKIAHDYELIKFELQPMELVNIYMEKQNYKYHIILTDEDNAPVLCEISPPNNKFLKYATVFNYGESVFLGGVYSKPDNLNNGGLFVSKLESHDFDDIEIQESVEFSDEFHMQYLDKKDLRYYENAQKKGENALWDYHNLTNRGMIPFQNGFLIFLEQTLIIRYSSSSTSAVLNYLDYVYMAHVSIEGKFLNFVKVPKKQVVNGTNFWSSYKVINDKLYFIFGPEDAFKKGKFDLMLAYVYDGDLIRKTVEIPTVQFSKWGLRTDNVWLSDNTMIATGRISSTKCQKVLVTLKY